MFFDHLFINVPRGTCLTCNMCYSCPSWDVPGCFIAHLRMFAKTFILSQTALQVQQRFVNLQTNAAAEENNYRDSIHLVKVTNNDNNAGQCTQHLKWKRDFCFPTEQWWVNVCFYFSTAPTMPQQMWTQSSVESASYDTDYEANDSGPNGDFTLSTFRSEFIPRYKNNMKLSYNARYCKTSSIKINNIQFKQKENSSQQIPLTSNLTYNYSHHASIIYVLSKRDCVNFWLLWTPLADTQGLLQPNLFIYLNSDSNHKFFKIHKFTKKDLQHNLDLTTKIWI